MAVPLHPEPGADGQELRWIIPPGLLPMLGLVDRVPDPLAALRDNGVIESVRVVPGAVVIRLSEGNLWRREGSRIRTALSAALQRPERWIPHEDALILPSARLAAITSDVLDGGVGEYIRSHGGDVVVVGTDDGIVEVAMTGACRNCPARDMTAKGRLERAVRDLYPELREVRLVKSDKKCRRSLVE